MSLYYLSDVHLWDTNEKNYQNFIRFMDSVPQSKDIVVLGGDLFDLYIGNKSVFAKKFSEAISSMNNAVKKGVKVYYLEGNHDFNLEFPIDHPNFEIRQDEFEIMYQNKNFWISHGDLINPKDYGYKVLRFVTRTWLFKWILMILPGTFVMYIGSKMSKTSRKYNRIEDLRSEFSHETKTMFREFAHKKFDAGYDFVFLGHSHLRDEVTIAINGRVSSYINLGFSPENIRYAVFSEKNSQIQLNEFSCGTKQ